MVRLRRCWDGTYLWALLMLGALATQAPCQDDQAGLPDKSELSRFGLTRKWWGQAPILGVREEIISLKFSPAIKPKVTKKPVAPELAAPKADPKKAKDAKPKEKPAAKEDDAGDAPAKDDKADAKAEKKPSAKADKKSGKDAKKKGFDDEEELSPEPDTDDVAKAAEADAKAANGNGDLAAADQDAGKRQDFLVETSTIGHRDPPKKAKVDESRGYVFAQSNRGMLHCFDDDTGALLWSQNVSPIGNVVWEPTVVGGNVYVNSGATLTQIDLLNGRVNWRRELPSDTTAGPAANGEYVYIPTFDRHITCIGLAQDPLRLLTRHPTIWYYNTGGIINTPPLLFEDRVVVVCQSGLLYGLASNKRQVLYQYRTGSPFTVPVAILEKEIYAANVDKVFALDVLSGIPRWEYRPGARVVAKPLPFIDDVFVVCDKIGLICIRNRDEGPQRERRAGSERWRDKRVTRLIGASQKKMYAFDRDNNVLILDRKTGQEINSFPAPGFTVSTENQINDRLYLSSKGGRVICLSELENDSAYYHPQKVDQTIAPDKPEEEKPAPKKEGGFFDEAMPQKKAAEGEPKKKKGAGFFDD